MWCACWQKKSFYSFADIHSVYNTISTFRHNDKNSFLRWIFFLFLELDVKSLLFKHFNHTSFIHKHIHNDLQHFYHINFIHRGQNHQQPRQELLPQYRKKKSEFVFTKICWNMRNFHCTLISKAWLEPHRAHHSLCGERDLLCRSTGHGCILPIRVVMCTA